VSLQETDNLPLPSSSAENEAVCAVLSASRHLPRANCQPGLATRSRTICAVFSGVGK
jgi:hypothetical protein